jgi:hypothetical protein
LPSCALIAALPLASCTSDGTKTAAAPSTNPAYSAVPGAISGEIHCPVCGEIVTTSRPSAMYGIYNVYCCSSSDAKQFASLSAKKRAELAAAQVLPQKRITNETCPLTGAKLTAAAAPVMYAGVIIGFATTRRRKSVQQPARVEEEESALTNGRRRRARWRSRRRARRGLPGGKNRTRRSMHANGANEATAANETSK